MTAEQLLLEGLELMLLGMGFVFTFLVVLIGAIRLMSRLIARFAPPPVPVLAPRRVPSPAAATPAAQQLPDGELLAAIQAAIHQHRARRG
ncbi:OadG family protein [Pseudomonas sp. NW5]|uniref:OadG family protein n=1 Tax=Pseudomonas sp. NW5 TaxID=2934934 RepID=UPI0020220719|nr:OadG family protein [Pseudomonas sp. NW5]MCL7463276.1 OadG family protein [Pseudomonas sp. NW5]